MSRLQQRQVKALSSLHDISDYSNYIDRRISKLNNLYQSLNVVNEGKIHKHTPFISRPTPQILTNSHIQKISKARQSLLSNHDQMMYRTQYVQKKDRYQSEDQSNYEQLKSLTISNFKRSIDASRGRFQKNDEKKPIINKKLQIYKQFKNDILGTFYVGGRTLSHHRKQPIKLEVEQINEEQPRGKRGKLWHGRPPVKIIQKYD